MEPLRPTPFSMIQLGFGKQPARMKCVLSNGMVWGIGIQKEGRRRKR